MQLFTVSFFGHRRIENSRYLEAQLEDIICRFLREKEFVEFLIGRNGEFDLLVSSVIRRIKKEHGCNNCAHVWVMPYLTQTYRKNERAFLAYYDEIEVCGESSRAHYKNAYSIRNQSMVDRSDTVVIHAERSYGGAYQALIYAQKKEKKIIRI